MQDSICEKWHLNFLKIMFYRLKRLKVTVASVVLDKLRKGDYSGWNAFGHAC